MNFDKKFLNKANIGMSIIIIIGIVVMINFFSYQIFYRWDLTENNDYSISKVSKKTAGKLDDVVNIKVYFSKDLPSQYITLSQEVRDILDEYVNYSNNNVRVDIIDPKDDEDLKRELMMIGIPELQFNVLEKDKYQIAKGYLGIAVQYGDNTEVIPVVENTDNLEYQITLAIKKVTDQIKARVGFVTSNGTLNTKSEISESYKKVKELYDVADVDLDKNTSIFSDINTLIIAGPKGKFTDEQIKSIDAFVMRGGSLLVLADGVTVGEGLVAEKNDTGLDSLLENYGVKFNHDLLLDSNSSMASFTQGFMTFSINYPLWPKILKDGFDRNSAIVANLESLVLPWASSLEIVPEKISEGKSVVYLAQTSKRSWTQPDNYDLNPQQMFLAPGDADKHNVAIMITGKFNSAYGEESVENGRLIVVGDSDFMSDGFIQRNYDNLIFFQNLVDSMSLDEDLINIRSKGVSERPIKELSDGAKAGIRYGNIFGVTIVVVAFGLTRYFLRRRSKFVDEL